MHVLVVRLGLEEQVVLAELRRRQGLHRVLVALRHRREPRVGDGGRARPRPPDHQVLVGDQGPGDEGEPVRVELGPAERHRAKVRRVLDELRHRRRRVFPGQRRVPPSSLVLPATGVVRRGGGGGEAEVDGVAGAVGGVDGAERDGGRAGRAGGGHRAAGGGGGGGGAGARPEEGEEDGEEDEAVDHPEHDDEKDHLSHKHFEWAGPLYWIL